MVTAALLAGCGYYTVKPVPYEAQSFEELNAMIIEARANGNYLGRMKGYYVPANPPQDMEIRITVFPGLYGIEYYNPGEDAYSFENENTLRFVWHSEYKGKAAQKAITESYNWVISETDDEVQQNGIYFRRIRSYGEPDIVFWYEHKWQFSAVVPKSWTWEQILEFCQAQWVPVTPQG